MQSLKRGKSVGMAVYGLEVRHILFNKGEGGLLEKREIPKVGIRYRKEGPGWK